MTRHKRRLLERVRERRERKRDAAAVIVAEANVQRRQMLERLDHAVEELNSTMDRADRRLATAANVRDLMRCMNEVSFAREQVHSAEGAGAAAQTRLDEASHALRQRARELKSVEKLLEMLQQQRRRDEQRNEQALADELAARKVAVR